ESGNTEENNTEDGNTATGDVDNGKQVYKDNCLACHGSDGVGGHNGPNLRESQMTGDLDAVIKQVTEGSGNMPAFGDKLSEEEILDVATYVNEKIASKG